MEKYIFPGYWKSGSYVFVKLVTSFIPTILLAEQLIGNEPPDLTLIIALLTNAMPHARLFIDLAVGKSNIYLGKLFRTERAIGIFTSIAILVYCCAFLLIKDDQVAKIMNMAYVPNIIQAINYCMGIFLNVPLIMSSVELACQLAEGRKQRDQWQKEAEKNMKSIPAVAGSMSSKI